MRMFYGNPLATTFMTWGWWDLSSNSPPPAQMIITTPGAASYTLTPLGQKWIDLMNLFSTHASLVVGGDDTVNFTGYYGSYDITVGGKVYAVDFTKGTTELTLVPEPSTWVLALLGTCALAAFARRRVARRHRISRETVAK
jgi:hypothetical protein